MKKTIDFPEVIINKVKKIMELEGFRTFTGAVIFMVNNYYDKKYFTKFKGPDIKVIPEAELTHEQYCESKGGKVGILNGNNVCIVDVNGDGSFIRNLPLDRVEEFI